MPVTTNDLTQLGDLCNNICYYLAAHLAAVGTGIPLSNQPPEVAQIYQLAVKLPKAGPQEWSMLMRMSAGGATGAAAAGMQAAGGSNVAKEPGKRMKWSADSEQQLIKLVEDEGYRNELLGKEGTRGGSINWASVARHFGFSNSTAMKTKYSELKGMPVERKAGSKAKTDGDEAPDGEKPAGKKSKGNDGAAAEAPPSSAKKGKEAGGNGGAATPGEEEWSKKQEQELVKLVEDAEERKKVLTKKKLRWKRIADHFGKKSKSCRKQYTRVTGKEAPEDED